MANTFKRKTSRNVGTTLTKVGDYDIPADTTATCIGLTLSNTVDQVIAVSVVLNDGTNKTYLVKNANVPAGGTLVVIGGDQKVVLETGDSIEVSSTVESSVDSVMSILEIS